MCGIAGLWAPRLDREERCDLVSRMVERLAHRGPSGAAVWNGDEISLGIARLAIVARHSPASVLGDEGGMLRAVVNGEVYNHETLRHGLRGRGHDVPTGPDTAVIPHLYEECGAQFPRRLDGMFAAAVWDARERRLTLARDRAGEKPLFVASDPRGFAFASEPAALLALPWISRDPSGAPLARYLVHGFFAGEDCAFAAMRQLPPAHVLEVSEALTRRTRYWRPWDALIAKPAGDRPGDEHSPATAGNDGAATLAEARARLGLPDTAEGSVLAMLGDAVESRVPGEVPFGIFLSGGVDSGLVATLAARTLGRSFPTFSMRIAHRGYDESGFAREVARSIGAEHHELAMDAAAGAEALEVFAANMDQPLGDPSVLPTWALARLASRHVPVILTGEGGDELFAGYPTYLGHRHAGLAAATPRWFGDAAIRLARRFRPKHHHVTIAHLVERFLATRDLAPFERHLAWFGTALPAEAGALLAPGIAAGLEPGAALGHVAAVREVLGSAGLLVDPRRADLTAYQLLDFELYLSGDLLTKVDRCTMAHGVESRAPFLRRSLVEFALGLPDRAKLRGGTGKWVLKRAARSLLPASVLARRKQGFSPPFSAWARGPLRTQVADILSPARVARAGVLEPRAVGAVLDEHLRCDSDRGRTLWTLVSLQMWAERWVAGGPASEARGGRTAVIARDDVARTGSGAESTVETTTPARQASRA